MRYNTAKVRESPAAARRHALLRCPTQAILAYCVLANGLTQSITLGRECEIRKESARDPSACRRRAAQQTSRRAPQVEGGKIVPARTVVNSGWGEGGQGGS